MPLKPVALDHVNIYVRNATRSHEWYTDILGLHTQDIFYHPGTERMRAAFLACDRDHAHDIALFEVGDEGLEGLFKDAPSFSGSNGWTAGT